MQWVVAVVVAGNERDIQHKIVEQQKLCCWYPIAVKLTKPKAKHSAVRLVYPAFRGYIFIEYRIGVLMPLLSNPEYASILGYITELGQISIVSDKIMMDLREREASGEFDEALANRLQQEKVRKTLLAGDKVLIQNGILGNVLTDKTGVVLADCRNKTEALVEVAGMKIKISVSFLEKIEDISQPIG
jgi:transcription antitermination factor NusG